jgi:NADH:ubiquinone reductase (non-electrogenic)
MSRRRLLILGSGFGSFSLLKRVDLSRMDATVMSLRNHFLFTPLLPSTTVGTLEFRSIVEPVRGAREGLRFYQAEAIDVDAGRKVVRCRSVLEPGEFELPYDLLAIGIGADVNTFGVPGVCEHAVFL